MSPWIQMSEEAGGPPLTEPAIVHHPAENAITWILPNGTPLGYTFAAVDDTGFQIRDVPVPMGPHLEYPLPLEAAVAVIPQLPILWAERKAGKSLAPHATHQLLQDPPRIVPIERKDA